MAEAAAWDDAALEDSALEEAFLTYRDAGLRMPPVPRELARALDELGDWHFATTAADLLDREDFLAAARTAETRPEVGFGQVGHGVASWYLCYRLILDPVAVFVRRRFGGISEDGDEGVRQTANDAAAQIEELIVLSEAARERGELPPGQRLIVVLDDRDGSFWQAGDGPAQASEDALSEALADLRPPS
ncbi:MAG: hypothetical protein JOZ05_07050 [Acetobacteraceae bacterium]|nr:hypothetical protein [Acetobacteraceae bacterium]